MQAISLISSSCCSFRLIFFLIISSPLSLPFSVITPPSVALSSLVCGLARFLTMRPSLERLLDGSCVLHTRSFHILYLSENFSELFKVFLGVSSNSLQAAARLFFSSHWKIIYELLLTFISTATQTVLSGEMFKKKYRETERSCCSLYTNDFESNSVL